MAPPGAAKTGPPGPKNVTKKRAPPQGSPFYKQCRGPENGRVFGPRKWAHFWLPRVQVFGLARDKTGTIFGLRKTSPESFSKSSTDTDNETPQGATMELQSLSKHELYRELMESDKTCMPFPRPCRECTQEQQIGVKAHGQTG